MDLYCFTYANSNQNFENPLLETLKHKPNKALKQFYHYMMTLKMEGEEVIRSNI